MRFLWLPALLLATSLLPAQTPTEVFQRMFEENLRLDPEFATTVGRHEFDDRWTDWSKTGREKRATAIRSQLAELERLSKENLSVQDRITVRLLDYDLRLEQETQKTMAYLVRFGQLYGFHNRPYLLMDRMPARTVRDYENLLARLKTLPLYIEQNIAVLDEGIEFGMTQARPVVQLVRAQIAAQSNQSASQSALLGAFRQFPSNIPEADQARLRKAASEAYEAEFAPAWKKLLEYVDHTYAARAPQADGLSSVPGGREAYAAMVRRYTTTKMTPKEIHELGLKEVDRLETAMRGVILEAQFKGSIAEFEKHMSSLPEQHFRSKDEMLAYCRNAAKTIEPELPKLFKTIPMLLYGIRAIPAEREAATASNAQAPSPDYSSPGWFNLNAYEPEKQVKYTKDALVLHEAVPGHIFQITLAQALTGIPGIRKFYGNSAYIEGWGLYAESLGSKLGVYLDPYSRFGQLASERFRAVRLVVDTGIHEFGWTREKAREYFGAHAPDASLAEVDRYISWPSQALSYKIGQLKIRQLRERAEAKLGEQFDVREFHDVVLKNGNLPLDLLEELVSEWMGTVGKH